MCLSLEKNSRIHGVPTSFKSKKNLPFTISCNVIFSLALASYVLYFTVVCVLFYVCAICLVSFVVLRHFISFFPGETVLAHLPEIVNVNL